MPDFKFDGSLWLPLFALVLGALAHALSADEGRSLLEKFNLPPLPRWTLPWLALGFGVGAGVVNAMALGKGVQESVVGALLATATAVFGLTATRVVHGAVGDASGAAVVLLGALAMGATQQACDLFTPSREAKAGNVAAHSLALAACRADGKDAGSYAVYERCADEADRKYGADAGASGGGK